MNAIRLSNLRPILVTGVWLGLVALLLNVSLYLLSASPALNWLPDRQTGNGFLVDNKQRIAGAERDVTRGALANQKLGAIVGISNIREAVDLDMVNRQLAPDWRFIGLAGAGAGAASVVENAELLEQSRLKPNIVIVGSAPLQMLDDLLPGREHAKPVSGTARIVQIVKEAAWVKSRRRDVSVTVERALLELRASTFRLFNVHLPVSDTRTPWRSMLRVMGSERFPDAAFRSGVTWAQSIGAFDALAYQRSKEAPKILASTLNRLSARGSRVVVVFTPEHSLLRDKEPSTIGPYLLSRLRNDSGLADLVILDYRQAVPDAGFVDLVHLNIAGSRVFTPKLISDIRRISAETSGVRLPDQVEGPH